MRIKVLKFGGTSVRTPEARQAAANKVVQAKESGIDPVVVVSAIGRQGEPYATDTLIKLVADIDPAIPPSPREIDLLISCGEILSSVIFAHTLTVQGYPAMSLRGGQAGIRTDGVYGNARITGINPIGIYECLRRGSIPVVCGFQGVWVQGGLPGAELTTLGRGGSDTTAAALGAALHAEGVEIYTDVDGVKAANPKFIPEAETLRKVTYDEVAEIAHLGATVLHPRAAEIAMKFGIPLSVKNTYSDDPGTEVVHKDQFPGRRITGVTHTGKLIYARIDEARLKEEHRGPFLAKVYALLAANGFNTQMIAAGQTDCGFAIDRDDYGRLLDVLDGLVLPISSGDLSSIYVTVCGSQHSQAVSAQMDLLSDLGEPIPIDIDIIEGCTMVSLVGHDYMQQAGVFLDALEVLEQIGVAAIQTSDSDYSLSILISEAEVERTVRALYSRFFAAPA